MEHSEAIDTKAAERYVLGEMTPEERDRFEEHFFDCSDCAQSVRDDVSIAAGIRTARPEEAAAPRTMWWAAAVAAALIAIVGYQNFVTIPRLRGAAAPAARLAHPVSLLMAESRGGSIAPVIVTPDEDVPLFFDVPPETPYPTYEAEVRDAAGKVRATIPISAQDARETVTMLIRGGVLASGDYEVVVSGVDVAKRKVPLAHYPFEVRFR
jgi:hypothetical protein